MKFGEFMESIEEGIRELCEDGEEIMIQKVQGNNKTVRTGVSIRENGESEAVVVYLKDYYERFQEGNMTIQEAEEEIYRESHTHKVSILQKTVLENFEEAKGRIVYRLVDYGRNRELLKQIPYIPYCDLAVIFYLLIETNENGRMTALIRNRHMNIWKTDADTLYRLAADNTPRLLPPVLQSMADVMKGTAREQVEEEDKEEFMDDFLEKTVRGLSLYVLTNRNGVHGAAAVLYDGVLKRFAKEKGSDLVILPSSLHEVLLMPCTAETAPAKLQEIVREVNRTQLSKEEVLSDSVYLYSRETNQVSLFCEG